MMYLTVKEVEHREDESKVKLNGPDASSAYLYMPFSDAQNIKPGDIYLISRKES